MPRRCIQVSTHTLIFTSRSSEMDFSISFLASSTLWKLDGTYKVFQNAIFTILQTNHGFYNFVASFAVFDRRIMKAAADSCCQRPNDEPSFTQEKANLLLLWFDTRCSWHWRLNPTRLWHGDTRVSECLTQENATFFLGHLIKNKGHKLLRNTIIWFMW